ncbi:MAG: amidohydrolase [Bacteroidota bacterium]
MIDLLVRASHIYPLRGTPLSYSCDGLAINQGRVVSSGSFAQLRQQFQAKEIIDLGDVYVYPGFHDAHCHLHRYAREQLEVDLRGCRSEQEMVARVRDFAQTHSEGWIVGRAWDQNHWPDQRYPNRQRLDAYFPDRPVYLERVDIHAALVNTKALQMAGFGLETSVPGGEIQKEADKLTGILIDKARQPILDLIPPLSETQWEQALVLAQQKLLSMGLVGLGDALLTAEEARRLAKLNQQARFQIPVYGMLPADEAHLDEFLAAGPQQWGNVSLGAFKLFADGALGSRGAWLKEPYTDAPDQRGLALLDWEETLDVARRVYEAGFQLVSHAIGDAAAEQVIDLYKAVLPKGNQRRWRIEHCQMMSAEAIRAMQEYQVMPSIQPTHLISDLPWVGQRLGDRLATSYPAQTLLAAYGKIALGTDFPVESPEPLATFRAAVSRSLAGEVFRFAERLSPMESLQGMTTWASFSAFWEAERGDLSNGKWADMVILDRNLLVESLPELESAKVLQTWMAGKVVFSAFNA